MAENIRIILPEKYDLVVGDTFQLFYRGVIEAPNPYMYSIVVKCKEGKSFPRYYEYTPTQPGQHKLTIQVVDADFTVLGSGETILNVVVPKKPEKPLNILCIGASTTQDGHWIAEANRRINGEGGAPEALGFGDAVKFVGSRETIKHPGIFCEAYGGWHWGSFLSNKPGAIWAKVQNNIHPENQHSLWKDENGAIWQLETLQVDYLKFNRYMDHDSPVPVTPPLVHYQNAVNTDPIYFERCSECSASPFFDPETGVIDFTTYAKRHNIESIDVVYAFLTINGLASWEARNLPRAEYIQIVLGRAKQLIGKIKEAFPHVQVRIMSPCGHSVTGGTGHSYGAGSPLSDCFDLFLYEHELELAQRAWAEEEEWKDCVKAINLAGQVDMEYAFPAKPRPVNTRSEVTESVGCNGVHLNVPGYLQIGDALYRNIIADFMSE